MLNGDNNENDFKTNRSISKKTSCTCSTLFLLISKKHAFLSLPRRCFARLQRCFEYV